MSSKMVVVVFPKKDLQGQKIARTAPTSCLNNSRGYWVIYPVKPRVSRQIAPESSHERSAKSLSHISVTQRGGATKVGVSKREKTQTNVYKRKQTQRRKRKQTQRRKRKQTQANVSKRGQTQTNAYTPPFIAVFFYTPLCNPLNTVSLWYLSVPKFGVPCES